MTRRRPLALREHVCAFAENRPGVYRMFGADEELLYVGKSVHLRTRLLSYFRAPRGEKAWELIREAVRIEWEYIPNEFAALLREMQLIQQGQPRFNVEHRRRRTYAFAKLTREAAPRILAVTRVVDDGSLYFGPFPRTATVANTVREVAHTLGLRDCPADTPVFFGDQLEIFGARGAQRCIRAELGSCLAPCCGRPTERTYHEAVAIARQFLEGTGTGPFAELADRMARAAARMEFEYAAVLRDRLARMERFQTALAAFRGTVEDLSFVYRVPGFRGDDRIYLIRRGRIRGEAPPPRSRAARAALATQVEAVFAEPDVGAPALTSEEAAEILLIARWFQRRPKERRRTSPPEHWTLKTAHG